eukprot:IDg22796t1
MYSRHSSSSIMLIALYVDDMLIAANSSASIKQIKGKFSMRFEVKDICTETVLERFGMHICKPVATPMEASKNNTLSLLSGAQDLAGDVSYRQAVCSLMYLMVDTRPDLAFAVGLLFGGSQSLVPVGYSDSDWERFLETRNSTSGYVLMLAGGAEALWLSQLLSNVHGDAKPKPITIHIDNSGSIATAQSTSVNQRNKHVDIQYHFVRDNVASGKVMLEYVSTTDQLADPITKPLDRVKTERFASLQGILPLD